METASDPLAIIQKVLQTAKLQLAEKRVSLLVDLPSELPALHVEPARFARMFELLFEDEMVNLPEGSTIRFQAHTQGVAGSPVRIQFIISDDGSGIPADSLRSVFDPFTSRDAAGQQFGINLLGVFFLAHHYGGSVRATDNDGNGVTYVLELPVTSTPPPNVTVSSQEFVTKVLVNDALWEKLLSGV